MTFSIKLVKKDHFCVSYGGFFVGIVLMKEKRKRFLPCSYHAAWDSLVMADLNVETEASDSLTMDEFNVETEASDSLSMDDFNVETEASDSLTMDDFNVGTEAFDSLTL